jgi:hypothetical protein
MSAAMQIEIHQVMPTRPCRFCLCLQNGCVFADFDVDDDGKVFAVRVSFDGFGCCTAGGRATKMDQHDSRALLAMVKVGDRGIAGAEMILRDYFRANCHVFWKDALQRHQLL